MMARPIEYKVVITKPKTGEIYSEVFSWEDYESPSDLRVEMAKYCQESVALGWDVEAFDSDGLIVFSCVGG